MNLNITYNESETMVKTEGKKVRRLWSVFFSCGHHDECPERRCLKTMEIYSFRFGSQNP